MNNFKEISSFLLKCLSNIKMEKIEGNNIDIHQEGEEEMNKNYNNQNQEPQEEQEDELNNVQDDESELMYIYEWVDSIELSRPKKNIARDFSDGVLLAEIIKSYLPHLVDLHNYPSCSNSKHKESNWNVLNNKVLKKMHIKLTKDEIDSIIKAKPLAIEKLLQRVYVVLQNKVNMNTNKEQNNFGIERNNNEILKKTLEEKDNVIKQLKDIVEVLELKLKNSEEMEGILQNKVQQLTEALNNNEINSDK
jgi:hypothetical protein